MHYRYAINLHRLWKLNDIALLFIQPALEDEMSIFVRGGMRFFFYLLPSSEVTVKFSVVTPVSINGDQEIGMSNTFGLWTMIFLPSNLPASSRLSGMVRH